MERRERVVDVKWVVEQLQAQGPAAVEAALADRDAPAGPAVEALRGLLARHAHLLQPLTPEHCLTDQLLSLFNGVPLLQEEAAEFAATLPAGVARLTTTARRPATVAPRRVIATGGHAFAGVTAPDGSWIAVSTDTTSVELYDVATGRRRPLPNLPAAFSDPEKFNRFSTLAVTADGTLLAGLDTGGSANHGIHLVETATGTTRTIETGGRGLSRTLAITRDGGRLVLPGGGDTVHLWDTATGEELPPLRFAGSVNRVALAGDRLAAVIDAKKPAIVLRDLDTGETRATLHGNGSYVHDLAISADGTHVAATDEKLVLVWDVNGDHDGPAVLTGATDTVHSLAWAPDGTWLAGADAGTVRIWAPGGGDPRAVLRTPGGGTGLLVAPDGTWLALSSSQDAAVRIWAVADLLGTPGAMDTGTCRDPLTIGGRAAVAVRGPGGTVIRPMDGFDTAAPLFTFPTEGPVRDVIAAPSGSWVAGIEDDTAAVRIWDAAGGPARDLPADEKERFTLHATSADGSLLCGTAGSTVVVWDTADGSIRSRLRANCKKVRDVMFGADGTWLALGCSDARIRIADLTTGRNRKVLNGHSQSVAALDPAPDGTWFASAGWDRTVRLWDARTGKPRGVLRGASDWFLAVAVSPDGGWVAAGGFGGLLYVWHVETGTLSATARTDARVISACRWLPDGSGILATGVGEAYLFAFTT